MGNQWYWHYEFSDIPGLDFDSFIKTDVDSFDLRLLSVDSRLVLPVDLSLRICVTSSDVLHSFRLPSSGIKVDAVPGLLNVVTGNFNILGLYYGQCSEICGSSHSFMPIVFEITNWDCWFFWIILNLYL